MLLATVLAIHITLALAICVGMIGRYIVAFKNKEYPLKGRTAIFSGAGGLVVTGVLLAGIGKLPITSLCLDSLGIVVGLLAFELGLQKLSTRLATEKYKNK